MTRVNVNPVVEEEASKEQMFTPGDYFWVSSKDIPIKKLTVLAQVETNMLTLIMLTSGNRFTDSKAPMYSNPNSSTVGLTMDQMKQCFDKHNRYNFTPVKEVTITARSK